MGEHVHVCSHEQVAFMETLLFCADRAATPMALDLESPHSYLKTLHDLSVGHRVLARLNWSEDATGPRCMEIEDAVDVLKSHTFLLGFAGSSLVIVQSAARRSTGKRFEKLDQNERHELEAIGSKFAQIHRAHR